VSSTAEPDRAVKVAPPPHVRIPLYAVISGLTEKAIRRKIEEGKWLEGKEYFRSPDGEIWIHIDGVARWVERGQA
jgi:hypothetical protein